MSQWPNSQSRRRTGLLRPARPCNERPMYEALLKEAAGWGFVLWVFGYVLGILLFFVVSPSLIGWLIMPAGIVVTLWVLLRRVRANRLWHYVALAHVWTVIAVVFDYFFIVKAFRPADGYYKLDVFLYYALTFTIPLLVGWWKAFGKPRAAISRQRSAARPTT